MTSRSPARPLRRLPFTAAALTAAAVLLLGFAELSATTPSAGEPVISGVVWDDADADEEKDSDEGVVGVTVQLLKGTTVETTATTNDDGEYSFAAAAGDDWRVRVPASTATTNAALAGRLPLSPTSTDVVVSATGVDLSGVDFGFREPASGTILVNTTDSAGEDDTVDSECSLVEAIEAAKTDTAFEGCPAGDGADKIWVAVPGRIEARYGFSIRSDVEIRGHADGTTVVVSGGGSLFHISVGRVTADGQRHAVSAVTLRDLTLRGDPSSTDATVDVSYYTASVSDARPYDVFLENVHIVSSYVGVKHSGSDTTRPGKVRVVDSVIEGPGSFGIQSWGCTSDSAPRVLEVVGSVVSGFGDSGQYGGGIRHTCGHLRVVDSIITGNTASYGGGIYIEQGQGSKSTKTEIINTTITGNMAVDSSGTGVFGGGVFAALADANSYDPSLSIVHSTIAGNASEKLRASLSAGFGAAGIVVRGADFDVTVRNSVVADNTRAIRDGTPADDLQCEFAGSVTGTGNASSDASCKFTSTGSQQEIDAGFVVDADGAPEPAVNGSPKRIGPYQTKDPVKTIAFKAGSRLLNTADDTACQSLAKPNEQPPVPAMDVRGVARPQGSGCDIGAYEMIVVGDRVWDDADGDGRQDSGEAGIGGVTVQLLKGTTVEATATTDADGGYGFPVGPGDWTVRVTDTGKVLAGRLATTATSQVVSGDPADVADALTADFGYRLAALSGVVWVDSDGDGVRDTGEPGLEGVAVRLLRDGSQAGSAETNAGGAYEFSGLVSGSYELVVTAPVGYAFTGRDVGSDDAVDSDVDPASGRSGALTLAAGASETLDAGVYRLGSPPRKDPDVPAPLLVLVKTASGEAPVGAGDAISYSFLVWNRGNVTLSRVSVADPKAGVVSCPGTVLAPEGSMTCTATYKASAADAKAGEVANTATVTGATADGARVSAADSATFDLASGKPTVDRLAGKDRYATAAVISGETFAPGVDVVYVATGVNFPDALAGSAASGGSGPILLVTKDAIPGATLAELKRLKPKRIVVLGGTGVVSAAVESALKEHATTTRQAGADRYATAAAISASHFGPGAATAFVATGADFPDALTGGPAAAKAGGPILLTQKDKLPAATVSELKRLKPRRIIVLGGTGVVSDAVEKALASYTSGKVSRLAGADRYSTGGAISKDGFDQGAPVVYVATGQNFPDALAGGAAGALKDGPVLLVSGASIPKATKAELTRLKPKRVVVLGGTAVVSESVRDDLNTYIR